MATTIIQSFNEYSKNLEITNLQTSTVANCRRNVTTKIGKVLSLHPEESKVIGSWARNTLARRLSEGDVDVMVVLHYGNNIGWTGNDGVVKCLDKFKEILQKAYPSTPMRRDVNCITMQLSQFRLDVVPSFKFTGSNGGGDYYVIPDSKRNQWIPTDPFAFASLMTNVNTVMKGDFKPLIKMVKGWNRENGWPIRSLHLEAMMYHHFNNYIQTYTMDSMLKVFFANLPSYLSAPCFEPIKNDRLDDYLDSSSTRTRISAYNKAKKAAELSHNAFSWKSISPEKSIKIWKILLGEFYPNYG